MKTVKNSLGVLMVVMLASVTLTLAQGKSKGHYGNGNPGRGHNKETHPGKGHSKAHKDRDDDRYDFDDWNHYDSHNKNDYCDHRHSSTHSWQNQRYVTYHHHKYGPPSWAPAYGYRYNTRYIYYKDYNVYYDCHRDVFITWTGHRWVISAGIPDVMCHVNFNRAMVAGVDYWDDDIDFYLNRKRPVFVSIRASW